MQQPVAQPKGYVILFLKLLSLDNKDCIYPYDLFCGNSCFHLVFRGTEAEGTRRKTAETAGVVEL